MSRVANVSSHQCLDSKSLGWWMSLVAFTDILVGVDFTYIWRCPIFLIWRQIPGTPNTRFLCVFPKLGGRKNVYLAWSNLYPLNYVFLAFFGKSKFCLGLGYTEACGTIRCHLKKILMLPIGTLSFLFFCQPIGSIKRCFKWHIKSPTHFSVTNPLQAILYQLRDQQVTYFFKRLPLQTCRKSKSNDRDKYNDRSSTLSELQIIPHFLVTAQLNNIWF